MRVVDRFVCRREGHIPAFTITAHNVIGDTYLCSCQRCGKVAEFSVPRLSENADAAASVEATKTAEGTGR